MDVALLLLFVSSVLAGCAVYAYRFTVRQDDHDHTDRLALAPLWDSYPPLAAPVPSPLAAPQPGDEKGTRQ